MTTLKITSREALEAAVASAVRAKIEHTRVTAEKERETSEIEKIYQKHLGKLTEEIAATEGSIQQYCTANRAELFPDKKSRETTLAVFGFELTPWRVETSSKKIKWKDVVQRLLAFAWGAAYVRRPEPQPDKNALLADREKLSVEEQRAAGIQFCQDEQFFMRPFPETAADSKQEAA
jgi:phage host-nuclease inhibitor protein Gam